MRLGRKISERTDLLRWEGCNKNNKIIIAGSTWRNDLSLFENLDYKIIIAPHELDHLERIKEINNSVLLSDCKIENCNKFNVLIIDEIGVLSKIYRYADIAYIGGGFGGGIHNVLEAVAFGLPVIFGPNYQKFNEAKELIKQKGAISICNYKELSSAIDFFNIFDKSIAINYIQENSGATRSIIAHI